MTEKKGGIPGNMKYAGLIKGGGNKLHFRRSLFYPEKRFSVPENFII
jgi:hypothetical protein